MPLYKNASSVSSYPHLREVFGAQFRDASAEKIESLFEQTDITAQEAEEFFSQVGRAFSSVARDVGRALPQVARVAAPIAQTALPLIGTAVGGPIGGMVGGLAGQALGGLAGQARSPMPQTPATPGMPARGGAPSGAAAQLMQLLGDPRILQSLGSLALGQAGSRGISAGNTRITPSAVTGLLGMLANQATADAMALESYSSDYSDYAENLGDPAVAESRAAALLDLLLETYPETAQPEAETASSFEMESETSTWGESTDYEAYYDTFFDTSESDVSEQSEFESDWESDWESDYETSSYETNFYETNGYAASMYAV